MSSKRKLIQPLFVSIALASVLYGWFYLIQQGGCGGCYSIESFINIEGYVGMIADSIFRTLSHANQAHLESNSKIVLLSLMILGAIQNWKITSLQLLTAVIASIGTYIMYPNVVGFSSAAYSIYTIGLLLYVGRLPTYFRKWKQIEAKTIIGKCKQMEDEAIFIHILIIPFLNLSTWLMNDVKIIFGYMSPSDVNFTYGTYSIESTEVHLIGVTIGIVIVVVSLVYKQKFS